MELGATETPGKQSDATMIYLSTSLDAVSLKAVESAYFLERVPSNFKYMEIASFSSVKKYISTSNLIKRPKPINYRRV